MSDKVIKLPAVLTVKELSDKLDASVNQVISILVQYGVMASINEDIDYDTASVVAEELGIEIEQEQVETKIEEVKIDKKKAEERPPVVTIMGHVDHGKTTLLDTIRNTNVASGEAGGITQAISSYQVNVDDPSSKQKRTITFVDTPGHSAFEAMRRHGVSITDLVVLVVAANEGVKPQTKEAIKHTKALKVPVIVAINKIDLPSADIEKTKRELSDVELVPEEWGGKTPIVEVSAVKGTGIDKLLEVIMLSTDLLELKADYTAAASGVIVESHMESGLGPVATILIQNGTLLVGQAVVIGPVHGKIRSIDDHRGKSIRLATPAMPVLVSGLSGIPSFGERMITVELEKDAREIARQNSVISKRHDINLSAAQLSQSSTKKEEGYSELSLVIKADTQGSLNAITELINNVSNEDVHVTLVKGEVGDVSEEDINRAKSSKAAVISFNTKVPASIKKIAQENSIKIHHFKVIYELEQLIIKAVEELMPELDVEVEVASMQIMKRFNNNRKHPVVGGLVQVGTLKNGQIAIIFRKKEEIARGEIIDIRTGREQKEAVKEGNECGIELKITDGSGEDIAEKDMVKVIVTEKVKKTV